MIDLTKFCSKDPFRVYLHKPWTRDGYTYATNGHIIVRVLAMVGVPENPQAPNVDKVMLIGASDPCFELPKLNLPREDNVDCEHCEEGRLHPCPDCLCTCNFCHGTGVETSDKGVSVGLGCSSIALEYYRLIVALPNVKIAAPTDNRASIRFTFDGGEGRIMPINGNRPNHLVAA